jgi:integrase
MLAFVQMEVFRLRWVDVNLKDGELEVVSRDGGTTKSYRSRRIPINPALEILLRQHPRRLGCELVFPNEDGQVYNNINTALKFACQRAGIPGQARNP